jgi:hypothetical protein
MRVGLMEAAPSLLRTGGLWPVFCFLSAQLMMGGVRGLANPRVGTRL